MLSAFRWRRALAEHARVVQETVDAIGRVPADRWHEPPRPAAWSPAAVTLHLCQSYELGRDVIGGAPGMTLKVPLRRAWVLRTFLVPVLLATKRFPRGARAPREVRPDVEAARTMDAEDGTRRLTRAAEEAARALHGAGVNGSTARFTHAYFGALEPLTALRVLSAHTRHHARGLRAMR